MCCCSYMINIPMVIICFVFLWFWIEETLILLGVCLFCFYFLFLFFLHCVKPSSYLAWSTLTQVCPQHVEGVPIYTTKNLFLVPVKDFFSFLLMAPRGVPQTQWVSEYINPTERVPHRLCCWRCPNRTFSHTHAHNKQGLVRLMTGLHWTRDTGLR